MACGGGQAEVKRQQSEGRREGAEESVDSVRSGSRRSVCGDLILLGVGPAKIE